MTTASTAPADPPRFHDARPTDLRTARPWHRLAYIVRALPAGIAELAGDVTLAPGGRVLDFGSAESPYRHLFPADADWVAADLPGNPDADVHVRADGTDDELTRTWRRLRPAVAGVPAHDEEGR